MATIKLYSDEVDEGQLPQICMRCGARADIQKLKRFSWCPGWVTLLILAGLLPWLIVTLVLTKRMPVYVPLCNRHISHWFFRSLITLSGLALVVLFAIATIVLMAQGADRRGADSSGLGGIACAGTIGLFVLLLVVAVTLQYTAIRPSLITNDRITLVGVAPKFKEALRQSEKRTSEIPEDYDATFRGPGRRRSSEDYYEPRERTRPPEGEDA